MLTFGIASLKVCITYSRCPCNKLWRRLECLNIKTTEVNISSTKQLLNNFRGEGQKWIVHQKKGVLKPTLRTQENFDIPKLYRNGVTNLQKKQLQKNFSPVCML